MRWHRRLVAATGHIPAGPVGRRSTRRSPVGLEYSVRPREVRFCASSSPAQPSCSWL
jgi:hypothetical protein